MSETKHNIEGVNWRKASRSNGNGGNNCVEVGRLDNGLVAIADSKYPTSNPQVFTQDEWTSFVDSVKDGEFDDI